MVDHIIGSGAGLFTAVRQVGAEGIVSKRAGSRYSAGTNREWLKAKVSETGAFVITGFIEREAVAIAELRDGVLLPVGQVKFGLASKALLWQRLPRLRSGPTTRACFIPVHPGRRGQVFRPLSHRLDTREHRMGTASSRLLRCGPRA